MPRIVSLIASATEIVCALGFEDELVGRSHECDYPPAVKRLPVCTSPKFEVEGLSYEIDQRVKAILQEALSVYRVDAAQLEALRPTVACMEWSEPLMAAGNWMPELVEMAGGINLFGEAGKHSPWMTWDELVAKDPDVILITPCGFDIRRTLEETELLTGQAEYANLKAAQTGRVFVADGNQYFNRPGPRLVESLEILAELLHPATFPFGHEGTGWQRLSES